MPNQPNPSLWEFESSEQMMSHLVGQSYGAEPEKKLAEIRMSKAAIAQGIKFEAQMSPENVALEIGSGCGFLANVVAGEVKRLHCADISASFLEAAKNECRLRKNISFHQITKRDLSFIESSTIDVVYAYNVFIHLNLFDIYWYFKEFARVVAPGGRVWFDIAHASELKSAPNALFLEMAQLYKDYPVGLPLLVQWQSADAVRGIAKDAGFSILAGATGSALLFVKG